MIEQGGWHASEFEMTGDLRSSNEKLPNSGQSSQTKVEFLNNMKQ